jgi:phenylpyruvate tautomerase PptA (4-oxalocrotonate tautomerase family)
MPAGLAKEVAELMAKLVGEPPKETSVRTNE